jgi:hypothetical protein
MLKRIIAVGLVGLCALAVQACALESGDEQLGLEQDAVSSSVPVSSAIPTYPFNRVWNPDNSLLYTYCFTTSGQLGRLRSKCAVLPATCGYLYCIPTD